MLRMALRANGVGLPGNVAEPPGTEHIQLRSSRVPDPRYRVNIAKQTRSLYGYGGCPAVKTVATVVRIEPAPESGSRMGEIRIGEKPPGMASSSRSGEYDTHTFRAGYPC